MKFCFVNMYVFTIYSLLDHIWAVCTFCLYVHLQYTPICKIFVSTYIFTFLVYMPASGIIVILPLAFSIFWRIATLFYKVIYHFTFFKKYSLFICKNCWEREIGKHREKGLLPLVHFSDDTKWLGWNQLQELHPSLPTNGRRSSTRANFCRFPGFINS